MELPNILFSTSCGFAVSDSNQLYSSDRFFVVFILNSVICVVFVMGWFVALHVVICGCKLYIWLLFCLYSCVLSLESDVSFKIHHFVPRPSRTQCDTLNCYCDFVIDDTLVPVDG